MADRAWYPEAVQQTSMLSAGIPEGVSASVSFSARALQQGLQNDCSIELQQQLLFYSSALRL